MLFQAALGFCCHQRQWQRQQWRLLSQTFSSWHFSLTSGDPHHSGCKFQTAVVTILCVMFQVQFSCVVNLLNVFLI